MNYSLPFRNLRVREKESEEAAARRASISRLTLRLLEANAGNPTLDSLNRVAALYHKNLKLLLLPSGECLSEYSTVGVSMKVSIEGFSTWKLHFMEWVDQFRKTLDPRLLLLPPVSALEPRLQSLLCSITCALCGESEQEPPTWTFRSFYLPHPWFVAEVETLKATALVESPLAFRKNNIFVLGNFLSRA